MKKIILSVIIIVVAILCVAGYFAYQKYLSPTTGPAGVPSGSGVEEWKTYTDTKYGFEFKYPASYNVENGKDTLDPGADRYYVRKYEKNSDFGGYSTPFSIKIFKTSDENNYSLMTKLLEAGWKKEKTYFTTIGQNIEAIADNEGDLIEYFIVKDGYQYMIDIIGQGSPQKQILDSFKFTK